MEMNLLTMTLLLVMSLFTVSELHGNDFDIYEGFVNDHNNDFFAEARADKEQEPETYII